MKVEGLRKYYSGVALALQSCDTQFLQPGFFKKMHKGKIHIFEYDRFYNYRNRDILLFDYHQLPQRLPKSTIYDDNDEVINRNDDPDDIDDDKNPKRYPSNVNKEELFEPFTFCRCSRRRRECS